MVPTPKEMEYSYQMNEEPHCAYDLQLLGLFLRLNPAAGADQPYYCMHTATMTRYALSSRADRTPWGWGAY